MDVKGWSGKDVMETRQKDTHGFTCTDYRPKTVPKMRHGKGVCNQYVLLQSTL